MRSIPGRRSTPRSDAAWLAARSRGECAAGSVFLHAPAAAFQAAGGGENQLLQTGRHLEAHGVRVRLFSPWTDRLESARLLHLFGMSQEGLELARLARSRGVPIAISPICWYQPRAIAALEPDLARKAVGLAAWCLRSITPRIPSWRRELLHLADVILPNSRGGRPARSPVRRPAGTIPGGAERGAAGLRDGVARSVPRARLVRIPSPCRSAGSSRARIRSA